METGLDTCVVLYLSADNGCFRIIHRPLLCTYAHLSSSHSPHSVSICNCKGRANLNVNSIGTFKKVKTKDSNWSRSQGTGSQLSGDYSHKPSGKLPLLSVRPAVTFPAAEHHRLLANTKLYCMYMNNLPGVVRWNCNCRELIITLWTRNFICYSMNTRDICYCTYTVYAVFLIVAILFTQTLKRFSLVSVV